MFNIKTATLVMGLTSLTCQPQAWAMDEDDLKGQGSSGTPSRLSTSSIITPSDVEAQLQVERLRNETLTAQIAAAEAEAEAAEQAAAAVRFQQQLEEERQKREELEERLRAAEAKKASLAEIEEAAHAPRPSSSDLSTRVGHNITTETARGILAVQNLLDTGRLSWRKSKKKKK